jgi:hypothetical protein
MKMKKVDVYDGERLVGSYLIDARLNVGDVHAEAIKAACDDTPELAGRKLVAVIGEP